MNAVRPLFDSLGFTAILIGLFYGTLAIIHKMDKKTFMYKFFLAFVFIFYISVLGLLILHMSEPISH